MDSDNNLTDGETVSDETDSVTFADFISVSDDVSWYRIWTGDADRENGNYVDTSAFNDHGEGWIEAEDLALLDIDFAQAGDEYIWFQAWTGTDGLSEWESIEVDFSAALEMITTEISSDTPMDEMFVNEDEDVGTWYQIWIGDADGATGEYLDTEYGKGWVESEDLEDYVFELEDVGLHLWVHTYTDDGAQYGWEHWEVNLEGSSDEDSDGSGASDDIDLLGVDTTDDAAYIVE